MKIGVVQFPGSNCERETRIALERVSLEAVDCYWHASQALLEAVDGFVIVGGFSYEDRVRSGLIAAQDPFMRLLAVEAAKGKPILGICNGAQILVESGLLGGPVALTQNQRIKNGQQVGTGFYNEWVEIQSNRAPTNQPIRLPIAHAEGRFLVEDAFYQHLQEAGAWIYTYCGENPNGSQHNLAGLSNAAGTVMALMPHPERTPAGDLILQSFFAQGSTNTVADAIQNPGLSFVPGQLNPQNYHAWVLLKIDDNAAISLENALKELGYACHLTRWVHWEFAGITAEEYQQILASDELFNHQKEYLSEPKAGPCYMVRQPNDEEAFAKQAWFGKRFNKPVQVMRDVVWCSEQELPPAAQALLGNPLSHQGLILCRVGKGAARRAHQEGFM